MINRRELINKFGGTALLVGAAAAVTSKSALAYDRDDDDWEHVRDHDRDYRCDFEHFDDCEDKVIIIKIVEIIKVKIVHFKRKDGYHKYHCYDDSWASCNDNRDGYWVETPKYDYSVVRYPKDQDCYKPFSHKESYKHKLWKGGDYRGDIWVNSNFYMHPTGHHKIDYSFDFKSKCHNKCDNYS
jgi:hypothetical protein